MSSEGTITGRTGRFDLAGNLVARTTMWEVNPTLATSSEWGDSDSGGYTNRAAGRRDATFSAEGKYEEDEDVFGLFEPGDVLESVLWLTSALYYHFPRALCSDFNVSVDIDTEEVVGWTSEWGADGIFYKPGAAPVAKTMPES